MPKSERGWLSRVPWFRRVGAGQAESASASATIAPASLKAESLFDAAVGSGLPADYAGVIGTHHRDAPRAQWREILERAHAVQALSEEFGTDVLRLGEALQPTFSRNAMFIDSASPAYLRQLFERALKDASEASRTLFHAAIERGMKPADAMVLHRHFVEAKPAEFPQIIDRARRAIDLCVAAEGTTQSCNAPAEIRERYSRAGVITSGKSVEELREELQEYLANGTNSLAISTSLPRDTAIDHLHHGGRSRGSWDRAIERAKADQGATGSAPLAAPPTANRTILGR